MGRHPSVERTTEPEGGDKGMGGVSSALMHFLNLILPVTNYQLPTTNYQLPIPNPLFPIPTDLVSQSRKNKARCLLQLHPQTISADSPELRFQYILLFQLTPTPAKPASPY